MGLIDVIEEHLCVTRLRLIGQRGPIGQAGGDLGLGNIEMNGAIGHVDGNHVAIADGCQRTAHRCLGGGVQDHRAIGGARHAGVGNAHHILYALAQHLWRQAHVAHFGHAGIALGAAVFEHHDAGLVDIERLVVDLCLVVVDVLEHHGAAGMNHQVRAGGRRFEHTAIGRKIALQNRDATMAGESLVDRPDHVLVPVAGAGDFLAHGAPGNGQRIAMELFSVEQGFEHYGQATSVEEFFHQIFARGHQIDDCWDIAAQPVPVVEPDIDPDTPGQGQQMDHGVGRTADGAIGHHRIFERFAGEDIGRFEVVFHHIDDTAAGELRHNPATAVDGGDCRIARKRHAQCLGHRSHGGGSAHGVARARGPAHGLFGFEEILLAHFAGLDRFAHLPQRGARADSLAPEPAIEHGAAGDNDRRNVGGGRAHQQRWGGLVATDQQDGAIDGLAAHHLFHRHGGEVAIHHCGGAEGVFRGREHRHLQRKAASFPDAGLYLFGQFTQMPVAGGEIGPGV